MHDAETEFYDIYLKNTGVELAYEPASFKLLIDGVIFRYEPDFYCPKTLTFFEVVGSRQAIHEDKFKIEAFQRAYPQLKLRIVNPDNTDYIMRSISYRDGNPIPKIKMNGLKSKKDRTDIVGDLLDLIKTGKPLPVIAKESGVNYGAIYRISKRNTTRVSSKVYGKLREYLDSNLI